MLSLSIELESCGMKKQRGNENKFNAPVYCRGCGFIILRLFFFEGFFAYSDGNSAANVLLLQTL